MMRLPGSKYCPSCGQDVPLDASLEGAYLLTSCANCGLGLGVKVASAEEVRSLAQAPAGITASSANLPALGRVPVVKRPVPLTAAVEKPGPVDPRSATLPPRGSQPDGSVDLPSGSGPSGSIELASGAGSDPMISGEMPAVGGPVRQMRRVFLVEDSQFLREVTRDLLVGKNLAREVVDCADGVSFVEEFARSAAAGHKPDLVILDVRMPEMDGRDTAFALRAIEAGLGLKRTPILFFSAVLCDEPFKAILEELGNAKYIRKAETGNVQELGSRIVAVLERLVGVRR